MELSKKQISLYTLLFVAVYMVSYITRINYGAIVSAMETSTGISRSMLSAALTGSFISYGAGQVISGLCGDRFSPKKLISMGFAVTVMMNMLIPLCTNPYQMTAVWCVNGFAQSFMWPPLVRVMVMLFTEEQYKKAVLKVAWGSSAGTIIVYLLSPLIISSFGWKMVFVFSAVCGIIMLVIWNKFCAEPDAAEKNLSTEKERASFGFLSIPMLGVMFIIVLQGMLRDGVTTWIPSYISEVYNLSNVISILTSVVLPIFSVMCFYVATMLYLKVFRNPVFCAGFFFGLGMVAALVLFVFSGQGVAVSVISSALLTGAMHGVNLMLICMVPPLFAKSGNVSTISGTLNCCTYIGSAISTYGIAFLSENMGWSFTLMLWLIITVLGTSLCLICAKPLVKKLRK